MTAALGFLKVFGPYLLGALLLAGFVGLVLDRNHLAALNNAHTQCLASVQAKAGSKPIGSVCEPPISAAVVAATNALACDALLEAEQKNGQGGVPSICSPAVQNVAAQRDANLATAQNLQSALDQTSTQTSAAVARATARGAASAQRSAYAQAILAAAPRDAGGLVDLDADRLRQLAGDVPSPDAPH